MKKFLGVVAVAAATLAMAVPANAANVQHLKWGTGGAAALNRTPTTWQTAMHVTGLPAGKYVYYIGVYVGVNGVPVGGYTRKICSFTSTGVHNTYSCSAHGAKIANWGGSQKPNLFTGEIDHDLGYTQYPVTGDVVNFS